MNADDIPLSNLEVDCDGSACGSGRDVGRHVHPPQHGIPAFGHPAFGRVVVRNHERIRYERAEGITRLVTAA
jgi:hypothetical protein